MTSNDPQQHQPSAVPAGRNVDRITVLAIPAKAFVTPRRVFRGDSRKPSAVFETGFCVRSGHTNTDIREYGLHNVPSPWIGCTVRPSLAAGFPQRARGCTWVYEIDSPGGGVNVNRVLGHRYVFRAEREIIFLRDIPSTRIVRAVWWSWGTRTDQIIENPGYMPRLHTDHADAA